MDKQPAKQGKSSEEQKSLKNSSSTGRFRAIRAASNEQGALSGRRAFLISVIEEALDLIEDDVTAQW